MGGGAVKVEMKLIGADNIISLLRSLPAEVVSKRGGPVKLALAKGARLIRDEAKRNLQQAIAENGYVSSGLLLDNVVASRGKAIHGSRGERYLVRVRRKTYPDRTGKPVTTHKTANLLEYGSAHQPATPWLRPAVQTKGSEAINVMTADLVARLDRLVKKLAKQGVPR